MDPDEMIARVVMLAEKIPDRLGEVVREAPTPGLTEPVIVKMLDGISTRCATVVEEYGTTLTCTP
jgi:hypothetical protein